MKVNRKKFFDGFKKHFDSSLDQSQVDGIEFLLTSFENEPLWKDVRHIAYALATIYHETAASMQPVEEGYYLGSPTRVKDFQKTLRYYPHFGRGYVQLTWERNYVKAGKALGVDFLKNPKLVMRPDYSFQILTRGMFEGWFTGKKLSTYIHGTVCDYVNARKIINGTDKAGLIAGYARLFEKLLRDSGSSTTAAVQTADSSSLEPEPADASTTPTTTEVVQNAEQIINTGDTGASTPAPVDVTLNAPQGMGSVQTATKVTVLGITVPPFILIIVETIKGWISDGFLDAKEIGNTVVALIKDNSKYILIAVGLVVVVIIIKKITRELIFLVTVITHAIPGWNSITVVAPEKVEPKKKWYQFWK